MTRRITLDLPEELIEMVVKAGELAVQGYSPALSIFQRVSDDGGSLEVAGLSNIASLDIAKQITLYTGIKRISEQELEKISAISTELS